MLKFAFKDVLGDHNTGILSIVHNTGIQKYSSIVF
jgi:hypothetical protein